MQFQSQIGTAVALAMLLCALNEVRGDVQPLPRMPGVEASTVYQVFVNDRPIPVGVEMAANRAIETAAFLFSGKANIRITLRESFSRCQIRPLRLGLSEAAKITVGRPGSPSHKHIQFSLSEPRKLLVELDGLPPLVLIASPLDKDLPARDDPNVLYFPPGVHEPGQIMVKSNQTIFLDAGAKVYGTIEGTCVENVRITGRGHLYGTKHTDWKQRTYGIVFDRSRNITIEKIGVRDCYWWTTNFVLCDGMSIRDANFLAFNRNNGGLMIDGCSNLTAKDCLLMCRDDCICPHALNAAGNGEPLSDNMLFENIVLYNVIDGNAIRIGASFETSEVRNWTFRNVDVVHRAGAAIYSDHSDWAVVRNLTFQNFTDEQPMHNSIDMRIDKTSYSCQTGYRDERGRFEGLLFHNLRAAGRIVLKGFDRQHGFYHVLFADCRIGDKRLEAPKDIEANEFVRGVQFLTTAKKPSLPPFSASRADSIRQPPASPAELIIDDGDDKFRAYGFTPQTSSSDAHQGDAHLGKVADQFGQYAAAIYEPRVAGRYDIHAYWGQLKDVDPKSSWIVQHRGGYSRVYLDQNDSSGWHHLGTFELDADSNVRLVFPNYFAGTLDRRSVVADAVRFTKATQEPPTPGANR